MIEVELFHEFLEALVTPVFMYGVSWFVLVADVHVIHHSKTRTPQDLAYRWNRSREARHDVLVDIASLDVVLGQAMSEYDALDQLRNERSSIVRRDPDLVGVGERVRILVEVDANKISERPTISRQQQKGPSRSRRFGNGKDLLG